MHSIAHFRTGPQTAAAGSFCRGMTRCSPSTAGKKLGEGPISLLFYPFVNFDDDERTFSPPKAADTRNP
jgi:hypothetical protein